MYKNNNNNQKDTRRNKKKQEDRRRRSDGSPFPVQLLALMPVLQLVPPHHHLNRLPHCKLAQPLLHKVFHHSLDSRLAKTERGEAGERREGGRGEGRRRE